MIHQFGEELGSSGELFDFGAIGLVLGLLARGGDGDQESDGRESKDVGLHDLVSAIIVDSRPFPSQL
jgi:hypothetical protein